MAILVTCGCGKRLQTEDGQVGRPLKCSACGQVLLVPAPSVHDEPTLALPAGNGVSGRTGQEEGAQTCSRLPRPHLRAEDYRVAGENLRLYGSLAVFGIIVFLIIGSSLGLGLLIVAVSAVYIKMKQSLLLGNAVKVSEKQFPEVYECAATAADRLSMRVPEIFVIQNPTIQAAALGFLGKKSVLLHSATVEAMDADQLTAILGHEFSHIKCGHTNWLVVTNSAASMVHIPIVSDVLGLVFLPWSRRCEFTCDRGGLLACRSPQATVQALAKVAVGRALYEKMNLDALFDQRREIDADEVSRLSELFETHPSIVSRVHALAQFAESPTYKGLSAG